MADDAPLAGWHTDIELSAGQRRQLAAVLAVLALDEHAPTTVRAPREATRVHLSDSLVALELASVRTAQRIADLGSGAGFPGVALAVALPTAEVSLIESQRRKCVFLEALCATAEIDNVRVVCVRAEQWREGIARNDLVLARALAAQPVVLEYAAPLLGTGGTLVDWRGRRAPEEELRATRAAAELGLSRVEVRRVTPFEGVRDHHLHVFEKVSETPARFPRRPGVASKRPLGG